MSKFDFLRIMCPKGEWQKIKFKAKITALAKEMVAFANASGGMGAFHISKTTVHRRITKLIADGWIEVHGSGRSTNYALSNVSMCSGKKEER